MPEYWAKKVNGLPGISVRQHGLTARHVARELVCRRPCICGDCNLSPEAFAFLADAHDVGKISMAFQRQEHPWRGDMRYHQEISQDSLQIFLEKSGHDLETAHFWAAVVGAHHGRVAAKPYALPIKLSMDQRVLEDERQTFLAQAWEECGRPVFPAVDANSPNLWLAAGLVILADWLASGYFPVDREVPEENVPAIARYAASHIGFGLPKIKEDTWGDCQHVAGPGVHALEVREGMDETEEALRTSYDLLRRGAASGIYFALPSQENSKKTAERVRDFVGRIAPDAVPAQLVDEDFHGERLPGDDEASDWFDSPRRALLAPFGVGSIDQALMSVLAVRYFPLRRFALHRKIVVVMPYDYDLYMSALIEIMAGELAKLRCAVLVFSRFASPEKDSVLRNLARREADIWQQAFDDRGFRVAGFDTAC